MPKPQAEIQQQLVKLVEALERQTIPGDVSPDPDRRATRRDPTVVHSEICLFHGSGETRTIIDAATRNLTFHGLSVVVHLNQPIRRGRPAEVIVAMRPGSPTHLAGIVTFCREIGKDLYEIGVNVRASGPCAVLMHDTETAQTTYEWFAHALECDEGPEQDAPLEVGAGDGPAS